MGERVVEDMVRVDVLGFRIRAWMKVDDPISTRSVDVQIVQGRILAAASKVLGWCDPLPLSIMGDAPVCRAIVRTIAEDIEGCAAVECLDANGNGSIAYVDWP